MRASPLARLLFGVYALLVVYATLYPLSGWREHGLSPFAYLSAPWPAYVTRFDIVVNVLGYVPLGFFGMLAVVPRTGGPLALALVLAGSGLLSLGLEAAQAYLPARIPTKVDVLTNLSGAAAGALGGLLLAPWLLEHGPLKRLRATAFRPGARIDVGLVLIGLWLFTQLNPATLLFGLGDLRDLVADAASEPRAPGFFLSIEAFVAAANLVVVALLLSLLMDRPPGIVRAAVTALVASALALKTGAFALMRADAFVWLTPGALGGLAVGLPAALLALALPRTARLVLAAVLVMAAAVLVNVAPANPYFTATLRAWHQGHFLHFNGLTRLVSLLWPFATLGYLMVLAAPGSRDPGR
ncbi:MAG TPA: VanZ family protein [Burkholderiales bacterium]|nr:VanZ family protein [Burkholderiales bacterium]